MLRRPICISISNVRAREDGESAHPPRPKAEAVAKRQVTMTDENLVDIMMEGRVGVTSRESFGDGGLSKLYPYTYEKIK